MVGFDLNFNYAKLTKATSYLYQEGTIYVATNTDSALPVGPGKVLPGKPVETFRVHGSN